MIETRNYGAVILAAGYSSRMKAFKPLLDVGGKSALERLTDELRKAGVGRIIVVTGYCREKLHPVLQSLEVTEAYNENYHVGMFSSIKAGLEKAQDCRKDEKGFFLMPVDCPLISAQIIEKVMDKAGKNEGCFCVPLYEGKKGHPLLVPVSLIDEICSYEGPGGLKAITDKHMTELVKVETGDEGCLLDMDTPEGYEEIKGFLNTDGKGKTLGQLAEGRRFFLLRHGETEQHKEKMFIGKYDVPLSSKGIQDSEMAAGRLEEDLRGEAPDFKRVYTSSLSRAVETGKIVARRLGKEVCPLENFGEIGLGPWDGKPLREIKEKYPKEYELRGRDIFAFKIGNGSENFYDMQYRAVKELKKVLTEDESSIIVIVSHSGVIRAIENNLKGLRVNDEWEPLAKGEYRKIEL